MSSAASYRSAVLALDKRVRQLEPNTALLVRLEDASDLQRFAVHEFDLRQFKPDVVDFLSALQKAVSKRASGVRPFIGLSPGFDSGALQVLLTATRTPHATYSLVCADDVSPLEARIAWAGDMVEGNIMLLSEAEVLEERRFLHRCERFTYSGRGRKGTLAEDSGALGLSRIFREARERGFTAPRQTGDMELLLPPIEALNSQRPMADACPEVAMQRADDGARLVQRRGYGNDVPERIGAGGGEILPKWRIYQMLPKQEPPAD
ncbi:unnamed protein product [Effrenium voratum]|nr:unnamed protein product [Effrenium voratum]